MPVLMPIMPIYDLHGQPLWVRLSFAAMYAAFAVLMLMAAYNFYRRSR